MKSNTSFFAMTVLLFNLVFMGCAGNPSTDDGWITDDWIADALGSPYKVIGHRTIDYVQGSTVLDVVAGQEYHLEWDIILPKVFTLSGYRQTQVGSNSVLSSKTGDILVIYRSAIIDDNTVFYDPYILIDLGEGQYQGRSDTHRSYHQISKP